MKGAGLQLISRVELTLIEKQFSSIFFPSLLIRRGWGARGKNCFQALLSFFFFLPEAKKAICENLFACLFSTIKCKILLPVSGLCHMSLPVTKPACLLMNPIRGKDLERFKGTEFLVQYFSVEKLLVCCSCCTWKTQALFLI